MLEYVFFDQRPFDQFIAFVRELRLSPECTISGQDEYLVALPDDLEDGVIDQVEAHYEKMMGISEELMAEDDDGHYSAAGVQVSLPDGSEIVASVEPGLLTKILTAISHEELGRFVDAIAAATLNPDSRPICKRD